MRYMGVCRYIVRVYCRHTVYARTRAPRTGQCAALVCARLLDEAAPVVVAPALRAPGARASAHTPADLNQMQTPISHAPSPIVIVRANVTADGAFDAC